MGFGVNIQDTFWQPVSTSTGTKWMTLIVFSDAPSGQGSLYIDAACSGIHSLTVFIAVFLLMLFEARKRHRWNPLVILVFVLGVLGTYIMNLIRIMIIISLYYYQGGSIAGPVHDYLGYVILIIWLPIFWLYVLPLADVKEVKINRKQKRLERVEKRKQKKEQKKETKAVLEEKDS
jgi:exosortase/archaeosortase family protein